ncbi:MAG: hypothetical protein LBS38_03315 [Endomicrobium sp.]|nr:hypothetical protein [Endomicrobium sp.]
MKKIRTVICQPNNKQAQEPDNNGSLKPCINETVNLNQEDNAVVSVCKKNETGKSGANVVDELQRELREQEENRKRLLRYGKFLNDKSNEEKAKLIQESYKAINRVVDRYIGMGQSGNVEVAVSNDKDCAFLERFLTGKYDNLPVKKEEKKAKGVRMNKKKRH